MSSLKRPIEANDFVIIRLGNIWDKYIIHKIDSNGIFIEVAYDESRPNPPPEKIRRYSILIYDSNDNKWKVKGRESVNYLFEYISKESVNLIGSESLQLLGGNPKIDIQLTGENPMNPVEINNTISFQYEGHTFEIINFLVKGAEALVYEGTYDGFPVIYSVHGTREIPDQILRFFPRIYLSFRDSKNYNVYVEEKLYYPEWSSNFYEGGLEFINVLTENSLKHGDISMNNVMMDSAGNFRVIDYSPNSMGTFGYPKGDRKALAQVLLEIKQGLLKDINKYLHDEIDRLRKELPTVPPELIKIGKHTADDYFLWVENQDQRAIDIFKRTLDPKHRSTVMNSIDLFSVYLKLKAAIEYLKDNYVPIDDLSVIGGKSGKLGQWIDYHSAQPFIRFYEWLEQQAVDNIDKELLQIIRS